MLCDCKTFDARATCCLHTSNAVVQSTGGRSVDAVHDPGFSLVYSIAAEMKLIEFSMNCKL